MDDPLTRHGKILEGLTTFDIKLNEAKAGFRKTLELILDWLNATEIRTKLIQNLNCDETGYSVCSINCKCNICIKIDATSLHCTTSCACIVNYDCAICIESDAPSLGSAGFCLCNIDCKCDICIGSDTSLGSEGLKSNKREIIQSPYFHLLDDPQVELDSFILRCTRELDQPRWCFNALLESVEIKKLELLPTYLIKYR